MCAVPSRVNPSAKLLHVTASITVKLVEKLKGSPNKALHGPFFSHNSCFGEKIHSNLSTILSKRYLYYNWQKNFFFHSFKPVYKPTTTATTKPNKNLLLHNEQLSIAFVLHQSSFNRQCTEVIVHLRTNGFRRH